MTLPAEATPLDGAPPRTGRRLGHVPALDGIRGVAVAVVLLFHAGVTWAPGGFLGVDVFFVLSGFLITTLLVEEVAERRGIGLRAFWTRRARRLIPALLATVAAVVALGPQLAPGRTATSVQLDAASALGYVANWRFILSGAGYFERTGGPSPLEHTWSLAVEEQFYLVWPLLALLLLRRRTWWLGAVALAGAVASAVAMALVFDPASGTSRAYFGTDTRVHVVLVGALAAVALDRWRAREREVTRAGRWVLGAAAGAGAAVVLAMIAVARGDEPWLYRGGFALAAVTTALVVVHVVLVPDGLGARALSIAPLRWLGEISYGAYLWHWPVFLLLTAERTGMTGTSLLAARLSATLSIAVISAVLLENPIRRGEALPGMRAGVVLPATAAVLAAVLWLDTTTVLDDGATELAAARAGRAEAPPPTLAPPAPGEPARVLVVGDSVAQTIADGMAGEALEAGFELVQHTVPGCGVARGGPYRYFGNVEQQPPQCEDWHTRWQEVLNAENPHVVLLVTGRWEVMDRVHDGSWGRVGRKAYDRYLREELGTAIEILSATGAKVAVATAPYYRRGERPDGGIWPEDEEWRVDRFNELLRRVVDEHAEVATIVDLNAQAREEPGTYTASVDGLRLRYDGVHFTERGARWLAPWLLPQLGALVPGAPAPPVQAGVSG